MTEERLPFSISDEDQPNFLVWVKEHDKSLSNAILSWVVAAANNYSESAEVPCQDGWHTGTHNEDVIRISYLEKEIDRIKEKATGV